MGLVTQVAARGLSPKDSRPPSAKAKWQSNLAPSARAVSEQHQEVGFLPGPTPMVVVSA